MNDLKALRIKKDIPVKDMVAVVQEIHPRYDRFLQSKVENGEAYGVTLSEDAMTALYEAFDRDRLTAQKRRKSDRHRLTRSIRARLPEAVYVALQQRIKADGYDTVQDWLADRVVAYLQNGDDLPEGGEPIDPFA